MRIGATGLNISLSYGTSSRHAHFALIDRIEKECAPDTWSRIERKTGELDEFKEFLVIRHTKDTHEQIASLIESMIAK